MPPEQTKKLPAANEFSPGQIELGALLGLASEHGGKRSALVEAIRLEWFSDAGATHATKAEQEVQQVKRANNVLIGMQSYGLIDSRKAQLTDLGELLLSCETDTEMYEAFAEHILVKCSGMEVLEAVRDIQARGDAVTKASLHDELVQRGFSLPKATTHHTKLLQWLREAKVIGDRHSGYLIDDQAVLAIANLDLGVLSELSGLSAEQEAFLRTVRKEAEVKGSTPVDGTVLIDKAVVEHGPIFKMDSLRARVYKPLADAGFIELSGVGKGRGGKSGKIAATKKLLDLDLEKVTRGERWGIPADLRPKLNTPLDAIQADLASADTHKKGIALELLAIRIARDLTLTPTKLRERGVKTGGAEVDLIAEGAHLHFSRWLFQCKNTKQVSLADLAKEVGMAVLLKTNVVVIVTTGRFASTVHQHANELARTTALQSVLVDGELLNKYLAHGAVALLKFFTSEAKATMALKREQVEEA